MHTTARIITTGASRYGLAAPFAVYGGGRRGRLLRFGLFARGILGLGFLHMGPLAPKRRHAANAIGCRVARLGILGVAERDIASPTR